MACAANDDVSTFPDSHDGAAIIGVAAGHGGPGRPGRDDGKADAYESASFLGGYEWSRRAARERPCLCRSAALLNLVPDYTIRGGRPTVPGRR